MDGEPVYVGEELDSKAIIKKKPPPEYSTKAEVRGIQGKVLLRAILSASGAVTHIEVVRGLPYGLNEKAIEAARLIRFIPAMKDGKPASEWVELEYNFWLL